MLSTNKSWNYMWTHSYMSYNSLKKGNFNICCCISRKVLWVLTKVLSKPVFQHYSYTNRFNLSNRFSFKMTDVDHRVTTLFLQTAQKCYLIHLSLFRPWSVAASFTLILTSLLTLIFHLTLTLRADSLVQE